MKKKMTKLFSIVIVFVLSFSFCRTVSFAHYAGTDEYWDSFSSDYYYRQMNKEQKRLYDRLYKECMDILTTEKDCTNYYLVSIGWKYEGISWYASSTS